MLLMDRHMALAALRHHHVAHAFPDHLQARVWSDPICVYCEFYGKRVSQSSLVLKRRWRG
jgi:hypothetical protein